MPLTWEHGPWDPGSNPASATTSPGDTDWPLQGLWKGCDEALLACGRR